MFVSVFCIYFFKKTLSYRAPDLVSIKLVSAMDLSVESISLGSPRIDSSKFKF